MSTWISVDCGSICSSDFLSLTKKVLSSAGDVLMNIHSLVINVIGICRRRNAASSWPVSTPFRKTFPICRTDSFNSILLRLASLQAFSIWRLIPFWALVTYDRIYCTTAYGCKHGWISWLARQICKQLRI